ncbi:hypothetical protein V6N13_051401 [Hibiscus sabdariffa]|uniref:Secreted protein n=1 Tax=Hibiscus sabdariffa TaxID=183260 RepID=A0ABR2T418_9ROSI
MLSTLSILLWFFALLLRGISSPGGGFQSSFRPGSGRDAVLSLHDNGVRSAVAVAFFAAPNLSMPRVSSLSLLAISVSFSGRHSQMAQGHGLDNSWITGLSTVVYPLGFFWRWERRFSGSLHFPLFMGFCSGAVFPLFQQLRSEFGAFTGHLDVVQQRSSNGGDSGRRVFHTYPLRHGGPFSFLNPSNDFPCPSWTLGFASRSGQALVSARLATRLS